MSFKSELLNKKKGGDENYDTKRPPNLNRKNPIIIIIKGYQKNWIGKFFTIFKMLTKIN